MLQSKEIVVGISSKISTSTSKIVIEDYNFRDELLLFFIKNWSNFQIFIAHKIATGINKNLYIVQCECTMHIYLVFKSGGHQ